MASDGETKPKVLLFGAGSVGTVYLYLLSKVASVTAVCRSNYDVVKEKGFVVNSEIFGKDIRFKPSVVRDCAEAAKQHGPPFDYILVCSKAIPSTIPKLIEPAVTPRHTAIALLQNGIGIEDEYTEAFPDNPIVSCVVYLPVTQRPPGYIKHGEAELLEIGAYPSTADPKAAKTLVNLLHTAGATATFYDDVQTKRWFKLLVNASWNPLCALTLSTDAELIESSEPAVSVALDIMLEVRDIAEACGYTISREEVDYQLSRAVARVKNKNGVEPSMLQDVRGGRRMEVDAIVGNAVKFGKDKGIRCEKLQMLYVLAKALDMQIGGKTQGV